MIWRPMSQSATVLAATILLVVSACGGGEEKSASPSTPRTTESASATPERYDPCSLLTQAERDLTGGVTLESLGPADVGFREWACEYDDAPVATATVRLTYRAARSPTWAAGLVQDVETTPSEANAPAQLAAALTKSGLSKDALGSLGAAQACDLWKVFAQGIGADGVATFTASDAASGMQLASSETCTNGVWASVRLLARDADSPAAQARTKKALSDALRRATRHLPR